MGIRQKLMVLLLFAALVPLAINAIMSWRVHHQSSQEQVKALHRRTAQFAAVSAQTHFDAIWNGLQLLATQTIRWRDLSDAERRGALWLVYRQFDSVAVTMLLDASGQRLTGSAYLTTPTEDLADHPIVSQELMGAFVAALPSTLGDASRNMAAVGPVYIHDNHPFVPVAFRVEGADEQTWFVAIALSLASLCERVGEMETTSMSVTLIDSQRHVVCGEAPGETPSAGLLEGLDSGERVLTYARDGDASLAAVDGFALAGRTPWVAVAEQPERVAFATSRRIRWQGLLWGVVSLVIAVLSGLFLAQAISRPVGQLVEGAQQLARGNYDYHVQVDDRGELGQLSESFNDMVEEIGKRDAEIREWNRSLQQRVEERTRALKDAQKQLMQTEKIAAMSSISAGIAHEINNPLTGLLGTVQILNRRAQKNGDGSSALLESIEKEAKRIWEITRALEDLTREVTGDDFGAVDVESLLESSLGMIESRLGEKDITLERIIPAKLPPVHGHAGKLREALLHVLNNAIAAVEGGGMIRVTAEAIEGSAVRITVSDDGVGIDADVLPRIFDPFFTTKTWDGTGLGLSTAFRIVEEHHGSIRATSDAGEGASFAVILPVTARSHLK